MSMEFHRHTLNEKGIGTLYFQSTFTTINMQADQSIPSEFDLLLRKVSTIVQKDAHILFSDNHVPTSEELEIIEGCSAHDPLSIEELTRRLKEMSLDEHDPHAVTDVRRNPSSLLAEALIDHKPLSDIQLLVAKGARLYRRGDVHPNILNLAAYQGDLEIFRFLLGVAKDQNVPVNNELLENIIESNHPAFFDWAISPDFPFRFDLNEELLVTAVRSRNHHACNTLLDRGIHPGEAFLEACRVGDRQSFYLLLDRDPELVDYVGKQGVTGVSLAHHSENFDFVKEIMMLFKPSAFRLVDTFNDCTFLAPFIDTAMRTDKTEFLAFLLQFLKDQGQDYLDFNLNRINEYGETAFVHPHPFMHSRRTVELLMEFGANPKIFDDQRRNIIHMAIEATECDDDCLWAIFEAYPEALVMGDCFGVDPEDYAKSFKSRRGNHFLSRIEQAKKKFNVC